MFGFEKLEVYNLAHRQYIRLHEVLQTLPPDNGKNTQVIINELQRAAFHCLIKFTEGSSIMEIPEKRKLYTQSRSAVFHSVTCLKILLDLKIIDDAVYQELYSTCESLSRMMLSLVKNMTLPSSSGQSNSGSGRNSSGGGHHSKRNINNEKKSNKLSSDFSDDSMLNIGDDEYDDFNKLTIGE